MDGPGLLRTALEDPNPVVFLEHKLLLKTRADRAHYPGAGDPGGEPIPFGQAALARQGSDITIAASGWMVQLAVEAASLLSENGISAEVIDLRSIVPLDRETLLDSVARTGHLLVVDEDYKSFGLSGELVAIVCEELGDQRPVVGRHAVPDVPIPASRPLEELVLPNASTIVSAAEELLHR
jgi:pyruvate dehydrogenase E1 component beta subunit